MGKLIACVVAYPAITKSGARAKFDMDYYLKVHMPMIDKYWIPHGMKHWNVAVSGEKNPLDGQPQPYIVQTTLYWNSLDDLKSAFAAPEIAETRADIEKFTDVQPLVWTSEIEAEGNL